MDMVSEKKILTEQKWDFYNNAVIPNTFPHEQVDTAKIKSGEVWKNKKVLLARWTSDFDCKEETTWWYVIKDDVFDIMALKSNRRYKITKGMKYFYVKQIDPKDHIEALYQVHVDAMSAYPPKYRKVRPLESFADSMMNLSAEKDIQRVYAAFLRETDELCGYVHVPVHKEWAALSAMKAKPQYEKYQLNAAMVYGILEDLKDRMDGKFYICDGARNIQHETNFQDYLENYFMFRKAYCHLHIQYRPIIRPLIKLLYPFRRILRKKGNKSIIHKINGVLTMEEIRRGDK